MKLLKVAGATSEIWQIFIQDSSSTTGAGLAGLVNNSAGLTAYYHRDTDTTATAISLVSMTVGTFTSSGFKEIDATNMPGWYQFCPPNAALAAGAKSCGFHLKGATNMAPLPIECQLSAVNPDSATAFITGVNSLSPPTNWNLLSVDANGRVDVIKIAGTTQTARDIGASVLLSSGSGAGQLDFTSGVVKANTTQWLGTTVSTPTVGGVPNVNVKTWNDLTTVALPLVPTTAGRTLDVAATGEAGLDFDNIKDATGAHTLTNIRVPNVTLTDTVTTYTGDTPQTGDSFARIGVAGAGLTNIDLPNQTMDIIGNITGNLSGSVGSVTGAVGSVTGNVGGNVTGSVGSVVGAVGSVTGAVGSVTGNVGGNVVGTVASVVGAVGSVAAGGITAASIATDAIDADALAADAITEIWAKACTEPTAVISASPTAIAALSWLATLSRNKISQTATTQILKADDGSTTVATSTVSDDGTTFTRGEFA